MGHTTTITAPKRLRFSRGGLVAGLVLSVLLVVVVALCLFWLPHLLVQTRNYDSQHQVDEDKALSDARANLLTATAGLAIIATGFFTLWRIRIEEEQSDSARLQVESVQRQIDYQSDAARRQEELTLEGQITERYSRAIEQLGQQDYEGRSYLDVRIGGIYALERIAQDAEARTKANPNLPARDHVTVVEVLSTFVLIHVTEGQPQQNTSSQMEERTSWAPRSDVAAAIRVLSRQNLPAQLPSIDAPSVNLSATSLPGVILSSAVLAGSDLSKSDLSAAIVTNADLAGARLDNASLARADLTGTRLTGAQLRGVDFSHAVLQDAHMVEADLTDATLTYTDIARSDLSGAQLPDADLSGAVLSETTLTDANLEGALLTYCDLRSSNLTGANLMNANLNNATLAQANLVAVSLWGATLIGAVLSGARLARADLTGADLQSADLTGADLQGALLTDADFTNCLYDAETVWPLDFEPPQPVTVAADDPNSHRDRLDTRLDDHLLSAPPPIEHSDAP